MTEQATHRITRGHLKASLTKLKNYAENKQLNKTIEDIEIRLERLEEITREFRKVDTALAILGEEAEYDGFEDKYLEVKSILRATLNSKKLDDSAGASSPANLDESIKTLIEQQTALIDGLAQSTMLASQVTHTPQSARLPKIELPAFAGDYKDWPSFKDLFTSCVGNRNDLTPATKLQLLKGVLKGEAASIIKHLEITDANYTEAWDKLTKRYDKKRQIMSSFMKTFLNQSPVTSNQGISGQLRRISDTSDQIIRGIDVLGVQATGRDPWLIHLILNKLDIETKMEWAEKTSDEIVPTFKTFIEFLNKRCDALETCEVIKRSNTIHPLKGLNVNVITCVKCRNNHLLFKCPEYRKLNVSERRALVNKHSLCFNCLAADHVAQKCKSQYKCHYCNQLHHSSLHGQSTNSHENPPSTSTHQPNHNIATQLHLNTSATVSNDNNTSTILPTALVYATNGSGHKLLCRILLDSGSQASFITEDIVKRLGIRREPAKILVQGLSGTKSIITKGKGLVSLYSRTSPNNYITVSAYILDKLTSLQPTVSFNCSYSKYHENYKLADPGFNISQGIDIIIGADYFFKILQNGQVASSSVSATLQNTIFGYIVAGKLATQPQIKTTASLHLNLTDIDSTLRKFWEIEELPHNQNHLTEEEKYCESLFTQTLTVDPVTNRYMVKLPFKMDSIQLGQSAHIATSCFNTLERKLSRNHQLLDEYKSFMEEYERLEHMERIPKDKIHTDMEHAYLPHHAIFKPSSTTTKMRVVFNGSSPTTNGVSLNQKLIAGPKVQRDLIPILLSFRSFKVAVIGDIEKMYRQVLVRPEDRTYQRIVWRANDSLPLSHLWLKTVTYGTTSASFLATRSLKQLTIEFAGQYPLAEKALLHNFYVDDLLGGASNDEQAIKLYIELTQLLKKRGFNLRKWSSNSTKFMQYIRPEDKSNNAVLIEEQPEGIKVLGLKWLPDEDCFSFNISLSVNPTPTKRTILAECSKIFDPLGLITPVTVIFKILLQQLWLAKINWDDTCNEIGEKWLAIHKELTLLQHLRIPRYLNGNFTNIQLHGFADASQAAYAAVIYCRAEHVTGEASVRILISKTKVSPIKQVSIPRLELCAAALLAKLMKFSQSTLNIHTNNCYAWTDSTIVLSWLSSHPCKWKSFVANRTSMILSLLPRSQWNHVKSADNPADLASRGLSPSRIIDSKLWWNGPSWLKDKWNDCINAPTQVHIDSPEINNEKRSQYIEVLHITEKDNIFTQLFSRHSKFSFIINILARCFQFSRNCKLKENQHNTTWLRTEDINRAYHYLILWVQQENFATEIKLLKMKSTISKSSRISALSPFLDDTGILRVGGRLEQSCIAYSTKHPIILPGHHIFSRYLVKYLHDKYLHAGTSLLLGIIRQRYWILSCRSLVKSVINKCNTCIRHRAATSQQLMANLPKQRVGGYSVFEHVGVDYAGPILLLHRRGRGAKSYKGYIVLFICCSTRAMHLELAGDLSSETFISCFKRFTSRRGIPAEMYSDNGTNFVGASKYLDNLSTFSSSFHKNEAFINFLSSFQIKWNFNPPAAPHFGGLWEAGVKTVKTILRRVIGDTRLTYEEMNTLLVQIEGLLNSRPLTVTGDDISSLDPLTPSHFLIGRPLTTLPERDDSQGMHIQERWRVIQRMNIDFWKRWSKEYLSTLQQRPKWQGIKQNIEVGDIVIIKEDNTPPSRWLIGRIIRTHPGEDNLVRAVTLQTKHGTLKRPIVKLVKLSTDVNC